MVRYKLIKGERSEKNRSRGVVRAVRQLFKWFKR